MADAHSVLCQGPQSLFSGSQNPTARVEYALRADDALVESQVRQVMEYYLAVRVRYGARTAAPSPLAPGHPTPPPLARSEPPTPFVRPAYVRPAVAVGGARPARQRA